MKAVKEIPYHSIFHSLAVEVFQTSECVCAVLSAQSHISLCQKDKAN